MSLCTPYRRFDTNSASNCHFCPGLASDSTRFATDLTRLASDSTHFVSNSTRFVLDSDCSFAFGMSVSCFGCTDFDVGTASR